MPCARLLALYALATFAPVASFAATVPSNEVASTPAVGSSRLLLELTERLRSGECRVGQRIRFQVAEDFVGVDALAVRKGTPALGTVTESRGRGRFGKRASLKVSID